MFPLSSSTSSSPSSFAAACSLGTTTVTFNATVGSALTGVTIATFTDADPNGTASDYTAAINWGDGDTTASYSIVAASGGFDEGSYEIADHVMEKAGAGDPVDEEIVLAAPGGVVDGADGSYAV